MKAKKYQGGGKMKEMKKKAPSRIHTSKASKDRESYKRDVREGYAPLPFAGGLPKRMTDAEDRAATKKEREAGKKIKKMKKGGRMGAPKDISGMGKFKQKMEKITPIGPKKIDSGVSMDKTLKKSAVEVDNKKKRRKKRRRKLENGGKVKRTANVNLRGEGKKKKPVKMYVGPGKAKKDMPFVRGRSEGFGGDVVMTEEGNLRRGSVGPDYGDYVNQEKASKDRLRKAEKIKPKGPDVIGLAKKVKPGTIKKSSAKIPVPAKKKRRLRRK